MGQLELLRALVEDDVRRRAPDVDPALFWSRVAEAEAQAPAGLNFFMALGWQIDRAIELARTSGAPRPSTRFVEAAHPKLRRFGAIAKWIAGNVAFLTAALERGVAGEGGPVAFPLHVVEQARALRTALVALMEEIGAAGGPVVHCGRCEAPMVLLGGVDPATEVWTAGCGACLIIVTLDARGIVLSSKRIVPSAGGVTLA